MRAEQEAYRILEAALSIASAGVDEAEVGLLGGAVGVARFAANQLHPSGENVHERLSLRLCRGGRWAGASTSDLSTNGIGVLAQQARAELDRIPDSMVGEGLPSPQSYGEVEAYDPATADHHPLDRAALAARAITAAHRSGLVASGEVAVGRGMLGADGVPRIYALANTRGLLAYHAASHASYRVAFEASAHRRARAWNRSYSLAELNPIEVVEQALWRVGFGDRSAVLAPGTYTAVLEPEAVAALVRVIGRTAGADRMARGESYLSSGLGERLVDSRVTIVDDFAHPAHRGIPFDCDGVARRRVELFEGGVAKQPVVGWASSIALERAPTGHRVAVPGGVRTEAAEHLVMGGGDAGDIDAIISGTDHGILVSGLTDVELLDGRTLRVAGSTDGGTFAIEGGELTHSVGDLRFEVSVLELLSRIDAMGSPRWAEGTVVPALRVHGFPVYAPA